MHSKAKVNSCFKILLIILATAASLGMGRAQLYVADQEDGTIREYDADTGALINSALVSDLQQPHGLAFAGGFLYVTEYGTGRVGKYDATTGAAINANLVTGLASPQDVAISGNNLYVTSLDGEGTGSVGKYDATTGVAINANLVTRLPSPLGIVAEDSDIFVAYGEGGAGAIGEYDANRGGAINTHLVNGVLDPEGLVKSGNDLWFVHSQNAPSGIVRKFTADTGRSEVGLFGVLIQGLNYPGMLALNGTDLFVGSHFDGTVGKYNATTGEVINASFVTGLRGAVSGIAVVPSAAPASATTSLRDQIVLINKVYRLEDIAFLLLRHWHVAVAILAVILIAPFFAFAKWARRRSAEALQENPVPAPTPPMKMKPILIGFTITAVLTIGIIIAYQIAMSFYVSKLMEMKNMARKEIEASQPNLPPPRPVEPTTVVTLPPTIIDSQDFQTENNWLASSIAHRIAEVVHFAQNSSESAPPHIHVHAKVDVETRQVHLEITGFSGSTVTVDLQPDFAWDATGYTPLAMKLLGATLPVATDKSDDVLPDELASLLQPTAAHLAADDVALSALLQKSPARSALHEQAAVLLVALALRDRASTYTDYRPMLSRATAHLAIAQALRGSAPATWAGEIANAAIRTLSGREVDATARLDALAARTDCPDSAKTWIAALRLRAKYDWRVVTPDGKSPLLLKIVWDQVLNDNLSALGASAHLDKLGPNLDAVSDWGHAALTNRVIGSVETSNQYCQANTALELTELTQELTVEAALPAPDQKIGQVLSEPLREKLFVGNPPALKIIGPDMFKDFARRNLIVELVATYEWLGTLLGEPDAAEKFRSANWDTFKGMRRFENAGFFAEHTDSAEIILGELKKENVSWEPWELANGQMPGNPNLGNIYPDIDTVHNFYKDGLPFGTAYDIDDRMNTLWIGASRHKEQFAADINYNLPTYPFAKDLQALAPSSFTIFKLDKDTHNSLQTTKPWWDYDLLSVEAAERLADTLDDDDYTMLMQKHAVLDPDAWFTLGTHLRKEGKDDDAAVADRKGFEQAYDQVGMSDSVGPLVDYYFDHNRKDEAEMIAKRAADVYSQEGLMTYFKLLEKENRLPEAERMAKDIAERYDSQWVLDSLYANHPDFFTNQNKTLRDKAFPHGLQKVTIGSFKGAPTHGCVFTGESDLLTQASLQTGDVVVALDGYQVESEDQYVYIRALTSNPHMDIIIWRKDHYLEVHASEPDRRFHVDMSTYPSE